MKRQSEADSIATALPGIGNSLVAGTRKALLLPFGLTLAFLVLGWFGRASTNPRLAWTFCGTAAILFCWQLVLLIGMRRQSAAFAWEFAPVRSHYMQAMVQFSVYVYWGWYWRNVYAEMPLILSQVLLLYALDALLTWSRGQTWRLGFGPWPIIFSTNLFMWFRDDWFGLQFLMVATGLLGKHFVRWRRNGKLTHIFNPSAFALTLFSLALIFTGTTNHTWGEQIAVTQGLPPHIYLVIFLGGVVVQYFFSVTLLTFSAAVTVGLFSEMYARVTGVYLFIDSNIPIAVFLGLHLLMTDPATTPRSSVGRIIFGCLYGLSVCAAFIILDMAGAPTFYDKLVVVPLLNLLTPLLDRLAAKGMAGKFGRWEAEWGPRKMNLAFIGCWLGIFLTMLATGFVEAPHPGATIAFWKKAAEEKRPHAVRNLQLLLAGLDRQNLDDASLLVGMVGPERTESREQSLGILCNQAGLIYGKGKLVPPDTKKAAHFFGKACELGNTEGCANLAIQYVLLRHDDSPEGVDHALSTLEKNSVASPNARNSFLLGYVYETGRGRPMDKTKARAFYEQSAPLGELLACKNLGRMQFLGEGGPPDHKAAAGWLQKAADGQDGPSCLYLARLYHNGDGVPQDEQRAVLLLKKACDLGVKPACELLQQTSQ